jgi:hypothetical protein
MLDSVVSDMKEFSGKEPGEAASAITEGLVKSQRRYRPLPGALPAILRTRFPAKVDTVALKAILTTAGPEYAKLHANDSTPGKPPKPQTPPKP